ncbi:PHP domain-containing protein [Acidaminococcus fermentans]|uniref:PHP domain-containing protein n=1 Tax=Acidaminococcus fermentans TaxID=905 RepID=UPI003F8C99C0
MSRFKVITHVHTKFSHDSILPFFLLYRKCLCKRIQYIAVTEHNNLTGAQKFQEYCRQHGDKLKVIPGEEIMTQGGELIGLYIHENIPPMLTPEETVAEIKKQGGIVYVPHPYDEKRYKTVLQEKYISKLRDKIDCIECHNGRNISSEFDVKQNAIAEKYRLKKVIGADAHTCFEIGRNYMETEVPLDSAEDFLEALNTIKMYPAPCLTYCHQITRAARVVQYLKKGDIHGLLRTVAKKLAH